MMKDFGKEVFFFNCKFNLSFYIQKELKVDKIEAVVFIVGSRSDIFEDFLLDICLLVLFIFLKDREVFII